MSEQNAREEAEFIAELNRRANEQSVKWGESLFWAILIFIGLSAFWFGLFMEAGR